MMNRYPLLSVRNLPASAIVMSIWAGLSAEEVKTQLCQRNKDLKNCDRKLTGPPASGKAGGGCGCGGQPGACGGK